MNYKKIYETIIENAKQNTSGGYTESHHIMPKCVGGTDDKDNLVELSAREHFICHLLLAKMYPDSGLIHAVWYMSNIGRYNSKEYAYLKEKHGKRIGEIISKRWKGIPKSEEQKQKISEANKGNTRLKGIPKSNEHKIAMSVSATGKLKSKEHKEAMSIAKIGNKNNSKSWSLLLPSGETIIVTDLKDFCKSNKLPYNSIYGSHYNGKPVSKGPAKGHFLLFHAE